MKFKAAPQSHIVPALKRIASALQSESITPEEVSYRLAMVRMALSQTAQQAVEAMGPIQADSREKVMDGFQKANPALTQDQLEEIADQWEKNKDQLKTAAYDRSLDWVKRHADRVEEYHVEWDSRLIGFSKKKWNGLNGDGQKKYEEELKRKALKPRYRAWEGDVFYDISKDTYEKSKNLFKTAAKRELLDPSAKKLIKALDDLLAQFKELRKDFPDSPSILDSIRNIETERAQVASTLGKNTGRRAR